MNFSIELAYQIYSSPEQFPIDLDLAWQWLGYSRKDPAKRNLLNSGFVVDEDYSLKQALGTIHSTVDSTQSLFGKPKECIMLTIDCFKMLSMMAGTEQGKQVRIYFLECERQLKERIKIDVLRSSNPLDTKEVELTPLEKPRLKLATKKLNLKQFVTTCKLFLDLIPYLDSNRKATLVFSAAKEAYPECAEIATMAQAALPPVAILEQSYTPTEIGSMLTPIVSARRVNTLIESAGLQESYQTARQQTRWKPTEAGREHSVLTIEAKHNGAPVESIRWKVSVLDLIILRATAINYLD